MHRLYCVVILILFLSGCRTHGTGNPSAEEVLKDNPSANIFMYKDTIYNSGVSWVDELTLTKDTQVTEIIEQKSKGKDFKNGTANKLTKGTKIYSVKERQDILIA